ncbi:MAG: secretin N-terminal domain-containing protein [Candidatus Firestonebacteria bacterium]
MKKILAVVTVMLLASFALAADAKFVEPPIDFPNTPVKVALETVFLKSGVQYSIDVDDITSFGNVTLTINERQELETVLSLILEPKNLQVTVDASGIYHIKKKEKDTAGPPRVTKLYALTYATAGELIRQMKTVLTKDGVVSVDVGTNALIITDVAEVFEGIESLLKELDNPERKAKLIAIKTKLIETIKKTDTVIGADIQYTNTGAMNIGGGTLNETVGSSARWLGTFYKAGTTLLSATSVPGAFFGPFSLTFSGTPTKLEFEMYATQATTQVDMVADPDVIVEDGTEARVQIGSREPITSKTTDSSGNTTFSYTYQDVNIILQVTPQSQRDGTISLQINPQMNQVAGYVSPEAGTRIPIIDNREVRTKLFVNNGGTIRLGGMLKERTTISESKVPLLGDIPLIGLLFKQTNPLVEKADVSLFVSPHIVDYAPPRCQNTPWISQYEIKVPGETDVLLDWKLDLPFGANGIFSYNIYRDVQPITDLTDRRPFQAGVNGDNTSYLDMSRKRRGQTYYYVVTAINPSGMEQSIDPTGKSNAVITIPER